MGHPNVRIVGPDLWSNAGVYVNKVQVATRKAQFYVVTGSNDGPDQWIQIFDSATEPAVAAVPLNQFKVLAGQWFYLEYPSYGRLMKNGIFIANSTTAGTYTVGIANCIIDTGYRLVGNEALG